MRVRANGNALRDGSADQRRAPMTRDQLNRELRMHSATWPAVLIVYGLIVGTMVLSAMSMT